MMHGHMETGCCGDSGACCCHGGVRKFLTKKEQIERLQKYAEALEKEIVGVKEHIDHLQMHKKESC